MPEPIVPLQRPLFAAPEVDWQPPTISDLPSWEGAKRVAFDTETCDPHLTTLGPGVRRGAYVVGYSFAIEGGPSYYVPLRHRGGDNVENPDQAIAYLRDQAARYQGTIVGMNLGYDLDFIAELGVEFKTQEPLRDVMLAEALIDELQMSYGLESILARYGLPGKDESLLRRAADHYGVDAKAGLWMLPARYVGAYAAGDTTLPLQLLRRQEKRLDEDDLWRIFDLESKLLPVLVRMRRRGVRVNEEKLAAIENWSLHEEERCLREVARLSGIKIEVGDTMKSETVAPAIEAAGFTVNRTPKGQPQVDKFVLSNTGEVGAYIQRARKMFKLRTTFAEQTRRYIVNGRIHCNTNQMVRPRDSSEDSGDETKGARYGRVSCSDPNLQQQPSRDDETPMGKKLGFEPYAAKWRDIYEPEEGGLWGSADYSQQEPRLQAHYAIVMAELAKPCKGFEEEDCAKLISGAALIEQIYRDNPNVDPHQITADMTGLPRKDAKTIYLGLCYGMGGGKLALQLGLPTVKKSFKDRGGDTVEYLAAGPEAQAILDQFDAGAPHVRALAKRVKAKVLDTGFIRTLGGRRCRFPKDKRNRYEWTHKSLNRLIQGSGADQTKAAMIELDSQGYFLQLQIHDSIEATVGSESETARIAEIMRDIIPLRVPVKVDYKSGCSWGAVK